MADATRSVRWIRTVLGKARSTVAVSTHGRRRRRRSAAAAVDRHHRLTATEPGAGGRLGRE